MWQRCLICEAGNNPKRPRGTKMIKQQIVLPAPKRRRHWAILALLGLAAVWLPFNTTPAYAASFTVTTEAEFIAALADSSPNIDIVLGGDITINSAQTITAGKTVTITSDSGQHMIKRGASLSGMTLGDIMLRVMSGASLSVTNTIFDGTGVAAQQTALWAEGTVVLGDGVIFQNHQIDVDLGLPNNWGVINVTDGSLTLEGNAQIINNTVNIGTVTCTTDSELRVTDTVKVSGNTATYIAAAFYINDGCHANLDGQVKITNNQSPNFIIEIVGDPWFPPVATISGDVEIADNQTNSAIVNVATAHADISGDVRIHNNTGGGWDGCALQAAYMYAYPGYPGSVSLSGNVQIYENTCTSSMGTVLVWGDSENPSVIDITGNVQIYDNKSGDGGGVALLNANANISGQVKIHDNTATGMGGGALVMQASQLTIAGSTEITGNTAGNDGGGIYVAGADAVLSLADTVAISDNTAGNNGGGIGFNSNVTTVLDIPGGVSITGNTAGTNGGGINLAYNQLPQLTVAAGATFSGNSAATWATRNPADDALYASNITDTTWTAPFAQGYNNYDITYANAELQYTVTFEPNAGGQTVIIDPFYETPESVAQTALPVSATVSAGGTIALNGIAGALPANPVWPGYVFLGWNTASDGSGDVFTADTIVDENITVYALWGWLDVTTTVTLPAEEPPAAPETPDAPAGGFVTGGNPFAPMLAVGLAALAGMLWRRRLYVE